MLKLACKMFSKISDKKRGEPIFQVWGGGKKGGEPTFFQNHRGVTKANNTMDKSQVR